MPTNSYSKLQKMTDSSKHIVIIGGSYAGIFAAKSIFGRKDQSVNVTLISSSTNAYFNVSTSRLIVEPEKIDKTLFPVEKTLKKYSNGVDYRFVLGNVVSSNFNNNSLIVENAKGKQTINYDYLIVATGARTDIPAFKLGGNHQDTVDSIKKLNRSTKGAKKIIILGGGPTGVETAGELGYLYGKEKEIVLYTGSTGPLLQLGSSKSATTVSKLAQLGVKVVNNKKSTSFEESGSPSKVVFEDGSSEDADVVIPAYGLTPNSEFLDVKFLDSLGYLKTDEYLRVEGHHNVIGLGDILSIGENTILNIKYSQMAAFESVVDLELFGNKNSKLQPYSPIKTTLGVPVSRDWGVGVALGWSLPSFIIKFMKSKDFMIPKASEMLA
ncbi:DEHA2B13068p [Debaryomyces hansenii CBS767]|uniref:DEHA2B13068p n=1 Tax=Debaryomyces hansenii (strain ATCC 36239 / CBS 767 / BCRC 21394 / JCM 1990 / NBRC 0083 / IGC 2968) TaxID=284592 RepID=Q6BWA6_DEBHA|nr:DEHA2B13068p [Debaryomyces hansenii CBS767]CAG85519.2 DEHA2B13068p [Debaryomyces hansenii CBS767]|eukprot:XP_457513.2 DEHA2B13068p [Debaryomyces hansenii CBS767]